MQYGAPILEGSVRCELDDKRIQKLKDGMDLMEERLAAFADRFVSDPMVMSRITDVGLLVKRCIEAGLYWAYIKGYRS